MEKEQCSERQAAIAKAISVMEWEGPSLPGEANTSISLEQGIVLDDRSDPTHPLRRGRIKRGLPTALDIAATTDPAGQPAIDIVTLKSVTNMEAGE